MNIIYKAVLLDPESKAKLMGAFPPSFNETFYHHMTIQFGVKSLDDDIGKPVELKVVGYKRDDKAEAVIVQGVPRVDGKVPHITLSVAPGVKPAYSNELVKSDWKPVDGPTLKGIISFYTDKGWINKA